jgi:hypothetical protein
VASRLPPSSDLPRVEEQRGLGEVSPAPPVTATGQWLIEWRDRAPAGRTYSWELVRAAA